jgi:cytochrome c oxidase subunit 4
MDLHGPSDHHVPSPALYAVIFALLLVLTGVTTWVAFLDLGFLNNVIMLGIAVTKATLVVLYFMHLRWSPRLTWVFAASGFAMLAILVGITAMDLLVRTQLPFASSVWPPPGTPVTMQP